MYLNVVLEIFHEILWELECMDKWRDSEIYGNEDKAQNRNDLLKWYLSILNG